MIVINEQQHENYNAGPKAPRDVNLILTKYFDAECYPFYVVPSKNKWNKIKNVLKKDLFLNKIKKIDDYYIIQMPFSRSMFFKRFIKKRKTILFIHDLVGLRYDNKSKEKNEIEIYKLCDYIVAHNESMKEYLISKGIKKDKIYVLELFDYLCTSEKLNKASLNKVPDIVYAGNLSEQKSPFLHAIVDDKINFNINLYGIGIKQSLSKKIRYYGSFIPEELPNNLNGSLGLVWDGKIDDSDENKGFKNYTKYNNPHKLSCYLAAGLPVIVWEKSAIANFVLKHNIGYVISNIYDINNLDFSDYDIKRANAEKICIQVRKGYYTKMVISKILKITDRK